MIYLVSPGKLPQVRGLNRSEQMKILKAAARELGEAIVARFPQAKLLDAMVIGVALMEFPYGIEDEVATIFYCKVVRDRNINIKLGCTSDPEKERARE